MSPLPPVPPDTHSWSEAVAAGFYGERTDPFPDTLYKPGVQADLRPTVTSVAPANGPEGGGTAVTLTGTLMFHPVVTIGGQGAAVTTKAPDGTSVVCTTPPGVGAVDVVVSTQGGSVTKAGAFTYDPPVTEPEAPEEPGPEEPPPDES
jgi:hypothetical protein